MASNSRFYALVSHLERMAGLGDQAGAIPDRQALAALRRILPTWPAIPTGALRVVAPFLPEVSSRDREDVYYLIAALFALHPCRNPGQSSWGETLGAALRNAARLDDSKGGPERRIVAMLNCRFEDLPVHLRHAISYLRSKDTAIDYRRLAHDLERWDSLDGKVQRRWGSDFWSGGEIDNWAASIQLPQEDITNVR